MAKVRTRKRGKTYSYVFEAGRVNGKRKVVEKGGFPSAAAAYSAGVEAFTSWQHGDIGITSERIALASFLELWLTRIRTDIRFTTFTNYESIVRHRISPFFKNIAVQELRPANIDAWLQHLFSAGYSKGYISQCRMVLQKALTYAVYPCELLSSNPCEYSIAPKNAPQTVVFRSVVQFTQFRDLVHTFPLGHPLHAPLELLWHTGLRLGEILGLMWGDIDFAAQTITVKRQRIYNSKMAIHERITAPKTEQSKRKIYVCAELLAELQKEKARQAGLSFINAIDKDGYCYSYTSNAGARGDLTPVDFVCVNALGKMVSRHTILAELKARGLNSHSFRHTQATRLAAAGVPPVTAARRLGHANPDVTLTVYTHDTEDQQKKAVSALEIEDWDKFFSS